MDHSQGDDVNETKDGEMIERVGEILQGWVARRELGNAEPAETLISQHPREAARLRECIESIEMLDHSGLIDRRVQVRYPSIPDFEILGELGRGGMGIVYEARQLSLNRIVALKVLPMTSVDPLAVQRFQREAETAAALHHTNIVPIHAVGRSEGVHWYAMQRIEGLPLDSLLRANPQGVDPDEVARIGIEAAEALAWAHFYGVVHRDIKPANLLIQADGHVWLTDFGLARRDADSAATITGAMLGTPRYMSPEQVFAPRGAALDLRSDIYSLGVTMYELVTGTALFDGTSALDVLQQIRVAEPAKPRSIRPAIPRDLEIVLQKCLAKDPKERYQSATDLANDLRAIRDGRPIKARGVPAWVVLYRRLIQHRARLKFAAGAIAGTAAVIALASLWWNYRQEIQGGQLLIDSVNGPYLASIYPLDSDSDKPIATTTVPMREPLRLSAGDYQIDLAAHGKHSQIGIVGVTGGATTRARYIDRRPSGKGIRYDNQQLSIVRGDDGRDLLVALNQTDLAVYADNEELRFQIAVNALPVDDQPVDFGFSTDDEYAGNRAAIDPYYAKPRRVLASTVDLDQDGAGDFVLSARLEPSIAAIKASGSVLWTKSIELPALAYTPTGGRSKPCPSVVDVVSTTDLDGDAVEDLVVTLVRSTDRSQVEAFIASVSGKSGQTIALAVLPIEKPDANRPLRSWPREGTLRYLHGNRDAREVGSINNSYDTHYRSFSASDQPLELFGASFFSMTLPVPPPLHLVEFDDKSVAVRVTDRSLDAWGLQTGQQVGPTLKLPFSLAARPLQVHSQASSSASFLIWSESSSTDPLTQTMALVVLGEESARWTANVDFHWDIQANQLERCDFPLIADLDGDGNDEILLAENKRTSWREPCRLTCYDSATGEAKWAQAPHIDALERLAERGVVMRDFDADGVRDVAVATITARGKGNPPWRLIADDSYFAVFVDLFSGRSGRKLGSWYAPFAAPHPMKFFLGIDRLCSDGDAKLEVSVASGLYEVAEFEATTMCFDLNRPAPATVTRGVSRLGRPDSPVEGGFYQQRPGIDQFYESRVFWMERKKSNGHTRIDANRLVASWVNPKGQPRLLLQDTETFRIRAVDTASGRSLWSRAYPARQVYAAPAFESDRENAAAANLLIQLGVDRQSNPQFDDGETGRVRWTLASELGVVEKAFQVDGETLQIYAHESYFLHSVSKSGMRLTNVDLSDGGVRWQQTTLTGIKPNLYGRRPMISLLRVDCDRDGVSTP